MSAENPEKKPDTLLGVGSVSSVNSVSSEEANKANTSNNTNNQQGVLNLFSEGFLMGRNEQTKVAILLYDHPAGLTKEEISSKLSISPDSTYTYVGRLDKQGFCTKITPAPFRYLLTDLGRVEIEKLYTSYMRTAAEQTKRAIAAREEARYNPSMELPEQIKKFQEFFSLHQQYLAHLCEQIRGGRHWVEVEFNDLSRFCPELAELLLEDSDEVLKAWQIAIEKMDVPRNNDGDVPRMQIRVTKLPATVRLSSITSKDLNHLVQVEAQVLTVSERRSMMTAARFECPSCGNILAVWQTEQKFREPTSCGCGRKGKFKLLSKDLVDACTLLLVQPLTELVGKKVRPSQLKVFLKNDLTRDDIRDHLGLNSMVRVVGVLHEVPIILQSGGQSTRFDQMLEAVSVQLLDHYNPQLSLSAERIKQIREDVSTKGFQDRIITSMFPRHVGDESIKAQLLCMSVALPLHLNSEQARRQAECEALNVLVAGDPGMGKSNLARRMLEFCPHGGRATGAGASKAGLTIAADAKDKENDLVIPNPGAIPNANMGIFVLDELDKMEITEQTILNEALSDHTVTITKRGVNTTLPANICFIGFANPRVKTWDLTKATIENEINIHYTLLTRCVVNIQADKADEDRDSMIARTVLNKDQAIITPFDDEYIQDYIMLARGTIHPKLRDQDKEALERIYVDLRKELHGKFLSPRFVEQLRSLTLLHAKVFLRQETRKEDVLFARKTLRDVLAAAGFESVALDVKEDSVLTLKDQLRAFIKGKDGKIAARDEIAQAFPEINGQLDQWLKVGDFYEAKRGYIGVLE